jgi:hypothetical protein
MSSTGQVVGGVIGGVIGFFVGNPVIGAQIGITLGGLVDPPKVLGPRLDDLSQQTSTYGAFIPRIYGTASVTGNIFWIQGNALIEHEAESEGKGGPEVTNFEYFATFAVGLCEGEIDAVRRIWVGGQLWYDAGSDDLSTIIASNQNKAFTLYTGSDTQLADPLIQADRGVANVPAYRGLAHIVFYEMALKDFGNSLAAAQVKVEVVSSGIVSTTYEHRTNPDTGVFFARLSPLILGAGRPFIMGVQDGVTSVGIVDGEDVYVFDATGESLGVSVGVQQAPALLKSGSYSSGGKFGSRYIWVRDIEPSLGVALSYEPLFGAPVGSGERFDHSLPADRKVIGTSVSNNGLEIFVVCGDVGAAANATNYDALWFILDTGGSILDSGTVGFDVGYNQLGTSRAVSSGSYDAMGFDQNSRQIATAYGAGTGNPHLLSYGADKVLTSLQLPSIDDYSFTSVSVFIDSGFIYVFSAGGFDLYIPPRGVTPNQVPLSSIVQSECLKSDLLTVSDLDVTELTDQVRGYRVSALAPLRGGIDPLRKAWPFDVIQHGYQIKFKKRGGASVATITEGELDAREAGATPGVRISNVREMDLVLPRQLTATYLDATREYDANVAEESRE